MNCYFSSVSVCPSFNLFCLKKNNKTCLFLFPCQAPSLLLQRIDPPLPLFLNQTPVLQRKPILVVTPNQNRPLVSGLFPRGQSPLWLPDPPSHRSRRPAAAGVLVCSEPADSVFSVKIIIVFALWTDMFLCMMICLQFIIFCFPLTFLTDESTDSPNSVSPRVTALPPTAKRMLSEGQRGLQSAGSPNKTSQDGESRSRLIKLSWPISSVSEFCRWHFISSSHTLSCDQSRCAMSQICLFPWRLTGLCQHVQ